MASNELQEYIAFWSEYEPKQEIHNEDYCILYSKGRVIGKKGCGEINLPTYKEVRKWVNQPEQLWYLGVLEGRPCFAYDVSVHEKMEQWEDEGLEWTAYRDERWSENLELYYVVIKAQQLLNWDQSTQFCGYCGKPYSRKADERAKVCISCGSVQYPRISPAIIVGIKKGEEILLAHNANFREGLYSVLAGFVEQGETLENAVKREVYEEVGIKIKNIQYLQSRPWIAQDSLMIGFIAEYESGEIKVDGKEILHADWYNKSALPKVLPSKISTARWIIDEILGLK